VATQTYLLLFHLVSLSPPCLYKITEHHLCFLPPSKPTTPPSPSVRAAPPRPIPQPQCRATNGKPRCASGRPWPRQGHPRARPVLAVLTRRCSTPAPTPTTGIEWPVLSLP
jgi:hypothetical protein